MGRLIQKINLPVWLARKKTPVETRPDPPEDQEKPLAAEFLPFLSSMEAARNRKGRLSSRLLLYAVCLTFFVFFSWSAIAEIEETVVGEGQVVPSQRVQQIQNLEGGILREMLVRESEEVDKGALLLRIDNEQAGSLYRDALSKSLELATAIARLEAELSGRAPEWPADLMEDAPEIVARHNNLLAARLEKSATERGALEAQLDSRRLEAEEHVAKQRALNSSLDLAVQQRDLASGLMASKSFSRMEYLNLEQRVSALQGELDTLESTIPRIRAAIRETEERLRLHQAGLNAEILAELNRTNTELATLREALAAGSDRVTRTEVRSPVRGVVKSVNISTEGGVIMPGQVIMEIVPLDDSLIVEARVSPQDIAFLFVGQEAKIRLTAYDFTIYGSLDARLENIGADTIEGRYGEVYYLVKLRTLTNTLEHRGQTLPILPGMMAAANILTGKKTVLDYILKPILKAKRTALRER
ncbi:MAG: HlyD family type I secretion periplasmic adaptor subunit [Desulfovibrionaceae bacterium]|nr:HlyD family type I secretion periplasmic adaptor subunit [Desulfovibrionaceae bacterium]